MRSFLPGRPQSSRQALCTVNWDGLRVIAYISGSTIIIFNGRREVLQSISVDEVLSLHSLSIDEQSGQLAVSDGKAVYLYRPLGRDYGDLRWARTHTLSSDASWAIKCLSWGSPDDLLVSGQQMTLWSLADEHKPEIIWSSDLSSPVETALFSPDGGLIASCGQYDRVVKIWRRLSYEQDSTRFDVAYLSHPATVTNLSWRQFWHQEQNLDNLLYTYCADGNIRVWAHTDHHALCVLQKVITLDTNASIQPRRMSMNSMSKIRFAFVVQSRDLARATERAVQTARSGTDHALEHLVEVANRSPEICVILDGLGHMSAWGIENVVSKSKALPEKFNVALVDGANITLPKEPKNDDSIQIIAFANNDAAASLCILVHSSAGQIDWYQGSFVSFFDTGAKQDRLDFQACWSGHDSVIDKMISSPDRKSFLSLTEDDQAIYWSQTENASLLRICGIRFDAAVIDATFMNNQGCVAILYDEEISVWRLASSPAKLLGKSVLAHGDPLAISCINDPESGHAISLIVLFEAGLIEIFNIHIPNQISTTKTNGHHEPVALSRTTNLPISKKFGSICLDVQAQSNPDPGARNVLAWSDSGEFEICSVIHHKQDQTEKVSDSLKTYSDMSNIVTISGPVIATVHADYRTITIWNLVQHSCEWTHTFTVFDHVQEVYWFSAANTQILAVQFPYHVVVVTPCRYSNDTRASSWTVHQVIQTRPHSSHVIGALCWLNPDQLAVGIGSQIMTFEVSGIASIRKSSDVSREQSAGVKAEDSIQLRTSSYGLYTPECLGTLLASSKLRTAVYILKQMHEELRYMTTDDELQLDESSVPRDEKPEEVDLSEFKSNLKEYMARVSDVQLNPAQKKNMRQLVDIADALIQNKKSMDTFALSYLFYFLQTVGSTEEEVQDLQPLPYAAIIGARLSETQEALLHYVLAKLEERKIKLTWSTARALGIFLFINDEETLRLHFESVARAEYNRNPDDKNPVDCSLYYLALDKKAILQSLWRRTVGVKEKDQTVKLLAHDFKDAKWKATALKNAYALLSRRRFEYAAAFFLLGGSLADAVNVCINQLQDFQLAVAIARVWAGNEADRVKVMNNLINKTVPELAVRTHEARSVMLWSCIQSRDWPGALRSIVKPACRLFEKQLENAYSDRRDGVGRPKAPLEAMYFTVNDPTLLINMYSYSRQRLFDNGGWSVDLVNEIDEARFVARSADWYSRAGLDWLALRLVTDWEFMDVQKQSPTARTENGGTATIILDSEPKSMLDEWMVPESSAPPPSNTTTQTKFDAEKQKPKPTQFVEPSADSLLDSFGF